MIRKLIPARALAASVFAVALACLPAFARGPMDGEDRDPAEIADNCKEAITTGSEAAAARIAEVTANIVTKIEEALANDDAEAAQTAADRGKRRVGFMARRSHSRIGSAVRRCSRAIRRAGGDQALIDEVRAVGGVGHETINAAAEACILAIDEALGG